MNFKAYKYKYIFSKSNIILNKIPIRLLFKVIEFLLEI